jgi:sigma-B regulation protein RsbU (phosphoserine phosphatase)
MTTIAPPVELHAIEKLRDEELEEARSIQNVMLPVEALCVGSVRISHAFQPVTEVGGDFLDYFQLADGCVGLYLGDVSGKGLPAAMYAALAVGTLRGVHKTGMCPSQVLATLNRRLMIRGTTRRHAAVQYAVFDPQTQVMKIAGGGMPGPFHLAANGYCRALEVQGIPPGLFEPSVAYETIELPLVPGDSVLFFTDGLSDAVDAEDESFGAERLQAVCAAHSEGSPTEFLGELFAAVSRFAGARAQHDDMAAAVFQYRKQ